MMTLLKYCPSEPWVVQVLILCLVLKLSCLNFSGTVGLDNTEGMGFLALVPVCVGLILFSCSPGLPSVGSVLRSICDAQVWYLMLKEFWSPAVSFMYHAALSVHIRKTPGQTQILSDTVLFTHSVSKPLPHFFFFLCHHDLHLYSFPLCLKPMFIYQIYIQF